MRDKFLLIGNPTLDQGFMEAMILAGRHDVPVLLTPPPRFEPLPFVLGPADEMLSQMLAFPRIQPRSISVEDHFARLVDDAIFSLVDKEVDRLLARRPRSFRPTGNKRSRRRRKG